jgi:hypothetical protein
LGVWVYTIYPNLPNRTQTTQTGLGVVWASLGKFGCGLGVVWEVLGKTSLGWGVGVGVCVGVGVVHLEGRRGTACPSGARVSGVAGERASPRSWDGVPGKARGHANARQAMSHVQ